MSKTCETCEWWKDAEISASLQNVPVDSHGHVTQIHTRLGYCEPLIGPICGGWKGLVASDYSCGEHKDRGDD